MEPFAQCNFMPCGALCIVFFNFFAAEHCASGSLCPVLWSVLLSVTLCHVDNFYRRKHFCYGALRQWIIVHVKHFTLISFVYLQCSALWNIVLCNILCLLEHCARPNCSWATFYAMWTSVSFGTWCPSPVKHRPLWSVLCPVDYNVLSWSILPSAMCKRWARWAHF